MDSARVGLAGSGGRLHEKGNGVRRDWAPVAGGGCGLGWFEVGKSRWINCLPSTSVCLFFREDVMDVGEDTLFLISLPYLSLVECWKRANYINIGCHVGGHRFEGLMEATIGAIGLEPSIILIFTPLPRAC